LFIEAILKLPLSIEKEMWIVKLFWSIIVSCVLTGVYAQWKTEVTPDGQSAVFSNDSGDAAIKN